MSDTKNLKPKFISKHTNKIICGVLGSAIIASSVGTMVYFAVRNYTFRVNDPWKDAQPIPSGLENYFNQFLKNATLRYEIGENDGVQPYIDQEDVSGFTNYINNEDEEGRRWTEKPELQNDIRQMLEGTGATLRNDGLIEFNGTTMYLNLLPTIIEYPYNGGDNKYGEVTFDMPESKSSLNRRYNIHYCLKLVAKDGAGKITDLGKDFDYTYQSEPKTISQLLVLAKDSEIQKLVKGYGLSEETQDSELANIILKEYYTLKSERQGIISNNIPIKGINNEDLSHPNADADLKYDIVYDSKAIHNWSDFGKSMIITQNNYNKIKNIFNKLHVDMPSITDVGPTMMYDRENSFSIVADTSSTIPEYKGNISGLGNTTDDNKYYGSQKYIFQNLVEVNFLNEHKTIDFIYSQNSFNRDTFSISNINVSSIINEALTKIDYSTTDDKLLSLKNEYINKALSTAKEAIKQELNRKSIDFEKVFKSVQISSQVNHSIIDKPWRSGTGSNSNKIYRDHQFNLGSINIKADFNIVEKTGSINSTSTISMDVINSLSSKIIEDPNGTTKKDISQAFDGFSLNDLNINTNTNINDVKIHINNKIWSKYQSWNGKLVSPSQSDYEFIINGYNGGNTLSEGTYTITIKAKPEAINFYGEVTGFSFKVNRAWDGLTPSTPPPPEEEE